MQALYDAFSAQFRAKVREDLGLGEGDSTDALSRRQRDQIYSLMQERARMLREASLPAGIVHVATLRRYLTGEASFSDSTQDATLLDFANYLGYANFEDFTAKAKTSSRQPDAPGDSSNPRAGWTRRAGVVLAIIALIGLVALLFHTLGGAADAEGPKPTNSVADTLTHEVAARILDAFNTQQFRLYESVPDLSDTPQVLKHSWADGWAYQEVSRIARGHVRDSNLLDRRRSNHSVLEVRLRSQSDTSALVETDEHWTLNWQLANGDTLRYDETNTQLYSLRRRGGVWKVHGNGYAGQAKLIEGQ